MNTMTPDDHELGERVGRALDRLGDAADVDRAGRRPPRRPRPPHPPPGRRRRCLRWRSRWAPSSCCRSATNPRRTSTSHRSSSTHRPSAPPACCPSSSSASRPRCTHPEAASRAAARCPRSDVWQSGDQRIIVRTFLESSVPESVPFTVALPSTVPPAADGGAPVIEQLADDQWVMFLTGRPRSGRQRGRAWDDPGRRRCSVRCAGGDRRRAGPDRVRARRARRCGAGVRPIGLEHHGRPTARTGGDDLRFHLDRLTPSAATASSLASAWSTGAVEVDRRARGRSSSRRIAAVLARLARCPSGVFVSVFVAVAARRRSHRRGRADRPAGAARHRRFDRRAGRGEAGGRERRGR